MTHHVATLSGGGGSWLAAKIVNREYVRPGDDFNMVFTDVLYEDADAYRFLIEGALNVVGRSVNWLPAAEDFPDYRVDPTTPLAEYKGNPAWREFLHQLRERTLEVVPELVWLVEGRDIWEVCRDERFLVNSGVDPCSKILKRREMDLWCEEVLDKDNTILYFGIGSAESHRYDGVNAKTGKPSGIKHRLAALGFKAEAPLLGRIEGDLSSALYMQQAGFRRPRLYRWASHNNCQGSCGKAGIKHRVKQMEVMPDRFAYDALMERKMSELLGTKATFLVDRRGGKREPMSLIELAHRQGVELENLILADEIGREDSGNGCGCMLDD